MSTIEALPMYRMMLKSYSNPTCVVAGPNRRTAWLYVHAPTPIVLRLHPPVVQFLLDTLSEIAENPGGPTGNAAARYRSLRKDTRMSYPECIIAGHNRDEIWLYVCATTPGTLRLTPPVIGFLLDALSALPAHAAEPDKEKARYIQNRWPTREAGRA